MNLVLGVTAVGIVLLVTSCRITVTPRDCNLFRNITYLLDVTPSNPLPHSLSPTHSNLCYSSSKIWLLSNIQQVCMYVCMHASMYVSMYVCMYVCMHASMYVSMYVCTYVCMYLCMYVCMYIIMHEYGCYVCL